MSDPTSGDQGAAAPTGPDATPYVPSSEASQETLDNLEQQGLWAPPGPEDDPAVQAERLLETPAEPSPDSVITDPEPGAEVTEPPVDDGTGEVVDADAATAEGGTEDEVFTVELTLPGGDGSDGKRRNAGKVLLEFATQEHRDHVAHLDNKARSADRWEGIANERQNDANTVAFLDDSPLEGMHWMSQDKPEVAQQDASQYLQANPVQAINIMQQLGYQVTSEDSDQQLLDRAKLATYENSDRVNKAKSGISEAGVYKAFEQTARSVVYDLAGQLGLGEDSEKFQIFATTAARKLAREYQGRMDAVTESDMMLTLQETVQEFSGTAPKVDKSADQPRDIQGKYAARDVRRKRHLQTAGGRADALPVGSIKVKPGETLDQFNARLEGG